MPLDRRMRRVNRVFLIPEPKSGDMRERNAFGMLKEFGEAAKRYYEAQDAKEKCYQQALHQALGRYLIYGREAMFTYGKSFTTSAFHVVHCDKDGNLGTTIAASNDEQFANSDATDRTRRAKEMGLNYSYIVKARRDGHVV